MHELTMSDRDLMLIDTALKMLLTTAVLVQEEWRKQDLDALRDLSYAFSKIRAGDQCEMIQKNAANKDRR